TAANTAGKGGGSRWRRRVLAGIERHRKTLKENLAQRVGAAGRLHPGQVEPIDVGNTAGGVFAITGDGGVMLVQPAGRARYGNLGPDGGRQAYVAQAQQDKLPDGPLLPDQAVDNSSYTGDHIHEGDGTANL